MYITCFIADSFSVYSYLIVIYYVAFWRKIKSKSVWTLHAFLIVGAIYVQCESRCACIIPFFDACF